MYIYIYLGFPDSSVGKESTCNTGEPGSIPGSGRSTGEGIGYPLQYSWASFMAHLVKNLLQYRRPGFDPWVGRIPWRRERLPTPVFCPGEFHGLHTSPWGCKESDTTEWLSLHIYMCVCIYIASKKLTDDTGSPARYSKDNLEVWRGGSRWRGYIYIYIYI